MWSVNNSTNKVILDNYRSKIIDELFNFWIECADAGYLTKRKVQTHFLSKPLAASNLMSIKISDSDTFEERSLQVIRLGKPMLEDEYAKYVVQNREVTRLNYNIHPETHPAILKTVFSEYFYEKFWSVHELWNDYLKTPFSRDQFHTNFKTGNNLYACPYCDSDTISQKPNSNVEHFLPKSKFPYLSCTAENLISSCISCNMAEYGKGENTKIPITMPLIEQIGNIISFYLEDGQFKIDHGPNVEVQNYVELLKLKQKYASTTVKDRAIQNFKFQYRRFKECPTGDLISYLEENGRINSLFFISRDILRFEEEII